MTTIKFYLMAMLMFVYTPCLKLCYFYDRQDECISSLEIYSTVTKPYEAYETWTKIKTNVLTIPDGLNMLLIRISSDNCSHSHVHTSIPNIALYAMAQPMLWLMGDREKLYPCWVEVEIGRVVHQWPDIWDEKFLWLLLFYILKF